MRETDLLNKLSIKEKKLLSFGKKVERENGKRKMGNWAHLRKSAKRCVNAVNELTIKPQEKKNECQLFWNYGAMTA